MTGIVEDNKLFDCTTTQYDEDSIFLGATLLYKTNLTRKKLFDSMLVALKMASKSDHSMVSFRIQKNFHHSY